MALSNILFYIQQRILIQYNCILNASPFHNSIILLTKLCILSSSKVSFFLKGSAKPILAKDVVSGAAGLNNCKNSKIKNVAKMSNQEHNYSNFNEFKICKYI